MADHPRGRVAGWVLLALAGLAIAVALSIAASNLSTQPIGLSREALRAGERLAPPVRATTPATVPRVLTAPPEPESGNTRKDDHGPGDPDHDDD